MQSASHTIQITPRHALLALLAAGLALIVLRGILTPALPGALAEKFDKQYVTCITDTPIRPGEPRQPECGLVTAGAVAPGVVPPDAQAAGVTRALCIHLTVSNPAWTTLGTTRHEIVTHARTFGKVALLRDGRWETGPDRENLDAVAWARYGCAGDMDAP